MVGITAVSRTVLVSSRKADTKNRWTGERGVRLPRHLERALLPIYTPWVGPNRGEGTCMRSLARAQRHNFRVLRRAGYMHAPWVAGVRSRTVMIFVLLSFQFFVSKNHSAVSHEQEHKTYLPFVRSRSTLQPCCATNRVSNSYVPRISVQPDLCWYRTTPRRKSSRR